MGINNNYNNVKNFEHVISFDNHKIKQIECHLAQSLFLLGFIKLNHNLNGEFKGDSQIVSCGYVYDSLTTNRILSGYKFFPKLSKFWQVLTFLYFV